MGLGGHDVLQALDRFVRFSKALEFECDLDVGVAAQGRRGGHRSECGDGLIGLFHFVEEVRQGDGGQVIARAQIQRQAKVDQIRAGNSSS